MQYVAFLRGINVGGHAVKMEELIKILSKLKLTSIKTLITSGNVLFESENANEDFLVKEIEDVLFQNLGYKVPVLLRTTAYIKKIVQENPFKKFEAEKNAKLYITFIIQKLDSSRVSKDKKDGFEIIKAENREVYSIVTSLENGKSGDLMQFVEKNYGKNSTTRNWNTLVKIASL